MSFFHIHSQSICIQPLSKISSSLFNDLINFEYSVPSRKTFVSSAKSIENNYVDERGKSFINNIQIELCQKSRIISINMIIN